MKKIKLICLLMLSIILCGCTATKNNLEDAKIYTTIYPVEYIVNFLYGDSSTIESIYPIGVDIENYKLTEKQIDEYSSGDLFVYVGINERGIAKSFIDKNKKLLIIDATRSITSDHVEELWLAPNNFLMLVKNIRTSLNEYLDNSVKEEEVNNKYDELYKEVSWIDAELRSIAKEASETNNNTLIIADNAFKYLSGYGFNIISVEDIENSKNDNAIKDLKNKFKNSTYKNIVKFKTDKDSDLVKELISNSGISKIEINPLITNDDSASDYVSIQYENLAKIKDTLLK